MHQRAHQIPGAAGNSCSDDECYEQPCCEVQQATARSEAHFCKHGSGDFRRIAVHAGGRQSLQTSSRQGDMQRTRKDFSLVSLLFKLDLLLQWGLTLDYGSPGTTVAQELL